MAFWHLFEQVKLTGGGGLAGVDMADDDDVDMSLFLTRLMGLMLAMIIDIHDKAMLKELPLFCSD